MPGEISVLLDELHECQSKLTAARDEAERLRARVAELENAMSAAVFICEEESQEWGSDNLQTYKDYAEVCGQRISRLSPVSAKLWLTQKQADAVEGFANHISCMAEDDEDDWWSVCKTPLEQMEDARGYAQRLRQQADDLDNV